MSPKQRRSGKEPRSGPQRDRRLFPNAKRLSGDMQPLEERRRPLSRPLDRRVRERRAVPRHNKDEIEILLTSAALLAITATSGDWPIEQHMEWKKDQVEAFGVLSNELVRLSGYEPEAFFKSVPFQNILKRSHGIWMPGDN